VGIRSHRRRRHRCIACSRTRRRAWVAILGWMMPGKDRQPGCASVRALWARPFLYALLLSARSEKDDPPQGLESGTDDYFFMPPNFARASRWAREFWNGRLARFSRAKNGSIAPRATSRPASSIPHDHRGHRVGAFALSSHGRRFRMRDAVWKEVARRMATCARPYDTVGRPGRKGFVIVAWSCQRSAAAGLSD
jgi:PleD family two-component response regulator